MRKISRRGSAFQVSGLVAKVLGVSDLFLRTLLEVGAIKAFRLVHHLGFRVYGFRAV